MMPNRVIQGFFLGGALPLQASQRLAAGRAQARPATGAPKVVFAGRAAPLQPRMTPGRPTLAHPTACDMMRLQSGNSIFEIDPVHIGLGRGGGRPLPEALMAKMETAFGADFSAVRVHVGPQAPRIGAVAFAMGNDLYFAPGRFQPDSVQGQQLIGHELAHVLQQRQGRVRASGAGVAVVQDRALEAEADRLGMRAAMKVSEAVSRQPAARGGLSRSVQRSAAGAAVPAAAPQAIGIRQTTQFAYTDRSDFSWLTSFAVTGPGDKSGIIIQKVTRTFGQGDDFNGERNVTAKQTFYECFDVDAAGKSDPDMFASGLGGVPTTAEHDHSSYCLLEGMLYFVSAAQADFATIKGQFSKNPPGVPAEISMPACKDLDETKIGPTHGWRELYFCFKKSTRTSKIRIWNYSEGIVTAQAM